MTNFITEAANHIINEFSNYLQKNNITLTEAATILNISRGQLSHILKRERSLNDLIGFRMVHMIKGKRPSTLGGIYGIYYEEQLIYIGKTNDFSKRWNTHKTAIKNKIVDAQPFHQSELDVNKLSYKILFTREKIPLFPHELNQIEDLFITIILPIWNTHLDSISSYHLTNDEKIQKVIEYYPIWKSKAVTQIIERFIMGFTIDGNKALIDAFNYTEAEILQRITKIVNHQTEWKNNE